MPKAAILFCVFFVSGMFVNSYAYVGGDLPLENEISIDNSGLSDSDIIQIDSDFFKQNNFKRYIIFGTGSVDSFLKNNSLYGIESSGGGFFYVAVLPERSISNLISKGYSVIEDFKLDFHTDTSNFPDA